MPSNVFSEGFFDFLKSLIIAAVREALAEEQARAKAEKHGDEWLDSTQAADFLKMSTSTFMKLTCKKLVPHYKRGGKILCKKTELIQWLEDGRQRTRDEIMGDI